MKYNAPSDVGFPPIGPSTANHQWYLKLTIIAASLEETLPGAPNPVVILCADIAGSTRLYDALGDTQGKGIVFACLAAMTQVTAARNGRVVKTIGDEALCVFPRAVDAVLAAGEMHYAITNLNTIMEMPLGPARIRIAIHRGAAIVEADEILGDSVKIVSQIVNLAKPDQTLATANVVALLPGELKASVRLFDDEVLDARRRPIVLHEVLWEVEDATDAVTYPELGLRTTHRRLALELADRVFELDEKRPSIALGRGESCEIRYPSGLASRHHARIEMRRGRFAIIDNSANGTFVVDEAGVVTSVHRDEFLLDGIGSITLGELPDKQGIPLIRYRCL